MKNFRFLVIVLLLLPSCQFFKSKLETKIEKNGSRVLAQNIDGDSRYHDARENINVFNSLMSHPLEEVDQLTGQTFPVFIVHARKHVERQFDSLYTGQDLMHKFDQELDRLLEVKKQKLTLDASDTEEINLLHLQLQIARYIYESNLHELSDLYLLTLETRMATEINGDEDLKAKTSAVLLELPKWLDEAWEKKYKIGAISVASVIDDVNQQFSHTTPAVSRYAINVDRFVKLSEESRQEAYLESKSAEVLKHFQDLFKFVEKSARRQIELEVNALKKSKDQPVRPFFDTKDRAPNTKLDDLYPSPGGNGHISGSKVPPNTWSLTLDDGPHPTHTPGMFKVFNDNNVPVTFFWLSKNMNSYPDLVAQARNNHKVPANKGNKFNVASHSMTHANLPKLSAVQLEKEITDAATLFEKIVGERPTLFRCPYGACGPMGSPIRQVIAKNNMIHVHWTVDPLDWQDKNPQSIFERSKKQIELRGKGIVLFHDVHLQSVEALKILIPYMKKKAYRMISMPQMVTEIREKEFYSP